MGNYATTTTISTRLPGFLISDTTTSDTLTTDTFSSYIDKAEAEFNAHAVKRYSLPFSTIPPLARDLSFEMAAWYTIRAFASRDFNNRNEVLEDFKMSFDKTKMVGEGTFRLTETDGSAISAFSGTIQSNHENHGQVFGLDEPTQWRADKDLLDELDGSRN